MKGLNYIGIIAGILLFIALADLPYGYYQFLRIAITLIAVVNLIAIWSDDKGLWFFFFVAAVILFNPLIPIHASKAIWTPIDLIFGIIFCYSTFKQRNI